MAKIRHKFNAQKRNYKGVNYDSKLEAHYASFLDHKKESGELLFYLRQVPIDLPGKIKYRIDFLEFWEDGTVVFTDCKGMNTPVSTLKMKQVEELYPININIVKEII